MGLAHHVIPGRIADANPESRGYNRQIPGSSLRDAPE
jgi:hypothetical protein